MAAVNPSRSKFSLFSAFLLSFGLVANAAATGFGAGFERLSPALPQPSKVAPTWPDEVLVASPSELQSALWRADALFQSGEINQESGPLLVQLMGSEVNFFVRDNYPQHKEVVDLAARLSGLGLVDMSVSAERLRQLEIDSRSLQPFVGVFVSAEGSVKQRREKEGFIYF